jgi:uncharacterized protein (DUF1015 family)
MAIIRPFAALRPRQDKAHEVASVPYDVVETDEARELAGGRPYSFLHVIRPEIDLPDGADQYDRQVYDKGRENLERMIDENILEQDQEPSLYLYRLEASGHRQLGIAACCAVEEYESGVIKKHEHTRKVKEDDRVNHMLSLSAHTGPVLMAFRSDSGVQRLMDENSRTDPLYDFTAADGVRHTLWRVRETDPLVRAFAALPALYIADGHHRAAGAFRVKEQVESGGADAQGRIGTEYRSFLAVLYPADQMRILAYNRYISDLGGLTGAQLLEEIRQRFDLIEGGAEPSAKGRFGMYLEGRWYSMEPKDKAAVKSADPVQSLDLSIFQNLFLEPVLGIKDQKSDPRVDFVGGEDSAVKLARRVDRGGGVGFTFYPVKMEELMAVADAGEVMPPKSTWFSPKLRSGLLVHRF